MTVSTHTAVAMKQIVFFLPDACKYQAGFRVSAAGFESRSKARSRAVAM